VKNTGKSRILLAWFLAASALPALADTRFTVRRMGRNDVRPSQGQCDIRLQVDDQVEVIVDGDQVFIRTLSGQDARDDGSECNFPLPGREVQGFNFDVQERRGDIQLVEGPTRRNGGKVVVRISDSKGGFGRYIFRLTWAMQGFGAPPPAPPERRPDGDDRRRDEDRRPPERVSDLRIVTATWGAPGRSREVTRLLQDRIRDGRLSIRASNDEMGFDPAVQVVKTLIVVYEIRGRRQEARIPEGNLLELP
jgi:hypothetical protein